MHVTEQHLLDVTADLAGAKGWQYFLDRLDQRQRQSLAQLRSTSEPWALVKAAIGTVIAVAAPAKRGEALSGLFLICYAGMSVPAVGVGVATEYISLATAMYWFSGILLAGLAATGVLARRTAHAPC